jgi:hypothetical protein
MIEDDILTVPTECRYHHGELRAVGPIHLPSN